MKRFFVLIAAALMLAVLLSDDASAQRRGGFTQQRLDTGLGEDDRGGEPVGPGSYDDGVWRHA